jgi:hypothetical protein
VARLQGSEPGGLVDRELLFWKLEHQLGVAAHTLQTRRSLYCDTTCTVKVDACCMQPALWRGVWPAAGLPPSAPPCSTCSYGIGPSACARRALARRRHWPPPCCGGDPAPSRVPDLGYADDAGLCGQTSEELQQLINCYCVYYGENGLLVNLAWGERAAGEPCQV